MSKNKSKATAFTLVLQPGEVRDSLDVTTGQTHGRPKDSDGWN